MSQPVTVIKKLIPTSDSGLASDVVEALYPQWAVNDHNLAAALAVVAEHHVDPVIRHTAATAPLTPVLASALERECWLRLRAERAEQHAGFQRDVAAALGLPVEAVQPH